MLAAQRHEDIARRVETDGAVRVKELSALYGVTEDCIRKDLAVLEKQGFLKRTYGGAVRARTNLHDLGVSNRRERNLPAKMRMAECALEYIADGDTVFLDISTVNVELAKFLVQTKRKVTVVSNMIDVMQILAVPSRVETIFLGGTFNSTYDGFCGLLTATQIESFRFDTAFMGVAGVDTQRNAVLTYLAEDGLTKSAALQASRSAYLFLESHKLRNDGGFVYGRLEDFTAIILDEAPPADEVLRLEEAGLELIVSRPQSG